MKFTIYLAAAAFLLNTQVLLSQERLGLNLEKYSGVNALSINPANGAFHALSWDVNLIGAGAFVENTFVYAQPTSISHLAKNSDQIYITEPAGEIEPPTASNIVVDYFKNSKSHFVTFDLNVRGPSILLNFDNPHAIGFTTSLRTAVSGFNLDKNLGVYDLLELNENSTLNMDAFSVAGMAWAEYGLHYSYSNESYLGKFGWGVNLKLLRGYEAFYLDSAMPIAVQKLSNDSVGVSSMDISFGMTTRTIDNQEFTPKPIGTGYGIDIGATWLFDEDDGDYRFKLGFSLLDIGKITFNKWTDNYAVQYNGDDITINSDGWESINSKEDAIEMISSQIFSDSSSIQRPAGFSLWTPGALSIQADFQVKKGLFVAALLNQRIAFSARAVERNNTFALVPRFENRWFSLGFPVVINNWQDFRLGTTARVGFITVGSDNIGSLFGESTLTGTDIYLAIKINPFNLNIFNGGSRKSRGKSIKCYKF